MKNTYKKPFCAIIALLMAFLVVISCARGGSGGKLLITFLKAGKADAIVLIEDGRCIVIDVGETDDGAKVVDFIKSKGVKTVETLIITHYDKDHIGGAERLLSELPVKQAILPDYAPTSALYDTLISSLAGANTEVVRLNEPMEFKFLSSSVRVEPPTVYPPADEGKETDNDSSLITTVTRGKNRLVFMGDAEKKRIRDYLENGSAEACAFVKMPHHGNYNKALDELLTRLAPKFVVICTSDKNPAEAKTLDLLSKHGCRVYETRNGSVTAAVYDENIVLSQSR